LEKSQRGLSSRFVDEARRRPATSTATILSCIHLVVTQPIDAKSQGHCVFDKPIGGCDMSTAAVSIPAKGTPAGFEFSGLPFRRGLFGLLRRSASDLAHGSPEGVTRPVCAQIRRRLNELLALGFAFVSGFALRHWASYEGVSLCDLWTMREVRHG
jgi:hypothetical protein